MTLTFADIQNMVAYLNKSDASEGFTQIIDFLNGSYIEYALTVNPTIYVSCIKQFWNTVAVKQSNDVTRLQALVDRKKVVVTEAAIRDTLRLDAKGVYCLPNEEIFTELACMGYEKPSTKLTFYKAFFSSQWKFLIYIILQSMSAKRTSWNEFSSAMTSAVICLSTGRKFNFSKYIFNSLVRNVESSSKFYMYPRRVGKGCSRVETPLFEGMLVAREPEEQGDAEEQGTDDIAAEEHDTVVSENDVENQSIPSPTQSTPPPQQPQDIPSTSQAQSPPPQPQSPTPAQPQSADFPISLLQKALDSCATIARRVEHLEHDKVAQNIEITKLQTRVKKLDRANKGRMIDELDRDEGAVLLSEKEEKKAEEVKDITDEPEVHEAVEVVTTTKLIIKVVAAVSETVSAAAVVPAATVTAAPVKAAVPSTRRKRGVVIRDPEEESSTKTPTETKSKDNGKGIMVEEPKRIKKKQQVELDEAYARKLHKELNQDIDWEVVIDHVKQKAKENPYVQRYQVMKKRPQTEAQARRNMMMYLKNTTGFRLDYFKGMYYDDIRLIFEAKFNSNIEFLLKSKEQIEEEKNRAIESINETPAQKAAKRRRLNKEAKDVEELKQHLEIIPDEDNDVYTKATPLARKVPVVDYQIVHFNNKPHYKIIRADGTHQLFVSFITLLKNFDREDLESLAMFKRPDEQDRVLMSQRSAHGQARVKSWKLLELCGVHIITFTTTQMILLVERRYPLSSAAGMFNAAKSSKDC
nr:hypothetical protein [Tanacetum cinerariifolium]